MTAVGEILELAYGKALKESDRDGGNIPVVGSGGVVGGHSVGITDSPTIVVGRKGSIGNVTWIDGGAWPIDTAYFVKLERGDIDARWIYWLLKSLPLSKMNKSAAVPGLNRDDVYRIDVDVPCTYEQRRIAAILDRADRERNAGWRVVAELAALPSRVFEEWFGYGGGVSARLSDVAMVSSGITKGRRTDKVVRPVPYLAVANVQDGRLDLDNVKTIEATEAEIRKYRLDPGDLVLTEGGDPDKLGRGTIWRSEIKECIHQNHIFRVRVAESGRVTPEYLSALISGRRSREYFLRSAKQTTGIASINMTQLRALPVSLPSMCDQASFGRVLQKVASIGESARLAATLHDQLFFALQARAFRGEL